MCLSAPPGGRRREFVPRRPLSAVVDELRKAPMSYASAALQAVEAKCLPPPQPPTEVEAALAVKVAEAGAQWRACGSARAPCAPVSLVPPPTLPTTAQVAADAAPAVAPAPAPVGIAPAAVDGVPADGAAVTACSLTPSAAEDAAVALPKDAEATGAAPEAAAAPDVGAPESGIPLVT